MNLSSRDPGLRPSSGLLAPGAACAAGPARPAWSRPAGVAPAALASGLGGLLRLRAGGRELVPELGEAFLVARALVGQALLGVLALPGAGGLDLLACGVALGASGGGGVTSLADPLVGALQAGEQVLGELAGRVGGGAGVALGGLGRLETLLGVGELGAHGGGLGLGMVPLPGQRGDGALVVGGGLLRLGGEGLDGTGLLGGLGPGSRMIRAAVSSVVDVFCVSLPGG